MTPFYRLSKAFHHLLFERGRGLAPLGARLCLDVIRKMKAGPVDGVKQDPALVTKAPKLKKEAGGK